MIPTPFSKDKLEEYYEMIYDDFFGKTVDYALGEEPNTLIVKFETGQKGIFKFNNNRDYKFRYGDEKYIKTATNVDPVLYDKREIFENCVVEIWSNSKTGQMSVGWFKRPEAQWMERDDDAGVECPKCSSVVDYPCNFCPHCGAKMANSEEID